MKLHIHVIAIGIAASLAAGCQGSGAVAQVNEKLAAIQDSQSRILARLDEVEGKIGTVAVAAPGQPPQRPAAPAAPQQPTGPDASAVYKVTLAGDESFKGPADAKVTLVEWSDFQCPYCSRVGPTIEQLMADYKGELRVVFMHNPLSFHNRALPAAIAAEAAGKQGKFWEMHDKLFANAKDLSDENFVTWAGEIGLDVGKFKKDLTDKGIEEKVKKQQALGMQLGARGTPAFFVNGRFLSGAQPVENFKKLIDEEISKADKLIAAGTPKSKVYEATVAKGKSAA